MLNKPSDFAIFGAFEIDETSVQWGIGMEWTDDINPFIFELYKTQTLQIFWTEGNRVIIRRDPAS